MHLKKRIANALLRKLLPQPVQARHAEYSMLFSADDDISQPSPYLLSIALQAVQQAQQVSLASIAARMPTPPYYPEIWPGENYKLLAGLVTVLKPKLVIEIGTGGGTSTLAIKQFLPREATLVTFDILGWNSWPGCLLREDDFLGGQLVQSTDDLSQRPVFARHQALFEHTDIIFCDAAKDGVMEHRLLDNLSAVSFRTKPLLIFDDIRLWNMLRIWRRIPFPKLDLTSFGHWTGTGIVEWGTQPLVSVEPTIS